MLHILQEDCSFVLRNKPARRILRAGFVYEFRTVPRPVHIVYFRNVNKFKIMLAIYTY